MGDLAHQELDVPLPRPALADVADDRGDADQVGAVVVHGGDADRDLDGPAILVPEHGVLVHDGAGSALALSLSISPPAPSGASMDIGQAMTSASS